MKIVKLSKSCHKIIFGFALVLIILCSLPFQAKASDNRLITLKPGRQYSSLDVTGDNKKDKIIVHSEILEVYPERYVTWIEINKKDVIRLESENKWDYKVKLCNINKKNVYFSIENPEKGSSQAYHCIYQYKNSKWRLVYNVNKLIRKQGLKNIRSYVSSTGRDRILVSFRSKTEAAGKIQWTASRNFTAHVKENRLSKSFRVKAGEKLKADRLSLSSGNVSMRVYDNKGRAGWVKIG